MSEKTIVKLTDNEPAFLVQISGWRNDETDILRIGDEIHDDWPDEIHWADAVWIKQDIDRGGEGPDDDGEIHELGDYRRVADSPA